MTNQPLSDITREVDLAFSMMGWISLVLLAGITAANIEYLGSAIATVVAN